MAFGKNRQNDIVTLICPHSQVNDYQSNQIGRNHCLLKLTDKGISVTDINSINGILLDGKRVDGNGMQIKTNNKELALAGVLKTSFRCLTDKWCLDSATYEKVLDERLGYMWQMATNAEPHFPNSP